MLQPYHEMHFDSWRALLALRVCHYCDGIGNKHHMIDRRLERYVHGRCYIEKHGLHGLLCLPAEQTSKLTLDDIGDEVKRILERRAAV